MSMSRVTILISILLLTISRSQITTFISIVFCDNGSETYIAVVTGSPDSYLWTGPSGFNVNSQLIEGYANVSFGTTSGNVTVEVWYAGEPNSAGKFYQDDEYHV